jgi:TatD DNase family protein
VLVDAHAHLDQYGSSWPEVLEEIRDMGVLTLAVSMDPPSYERTRVLCANEPLLIPAFGVHPWHAPGWENRLSELDRYVGEAPALGEVGLDFHFVEDESAFGPQREVFEYFLEAAKRTGKLLNIHSKGAEEEIARRLHDAGAPSVIVHWYSGPLGPLHDLLDEGVYFTVGVELLRSPHIEKIARRIPENRVLTETDNPGGWQWLEGAPGRPALLNRVLERLAEVRGVARERMEEIVADNATRLVGLEYLEPPDGG